MSAEAGERRENMRRKILCYALTLALGLFLAGSAMAGQVVVQGKCVSFDQAKNLLTVDEYNLTVTKEYPYGSPTGKQVTVNTADALIGITPAPGDIVRIAYEEKGKEKKALRVMNVSKQDLRKK